MTSPPHLFSNDYLVNNFDVAALVRPNTSLSEVTAFVEVFLYAGFLELLVEEPLLHALDQGVALMSTLEGQTQALFTYMNNVHVWLSSQTDIVLTYRSLSALGEVVGLRLAQRGAGIVAHALRDQRILLHLGQAAKVGIAQLKGPLSKTHASCSTNPQRSSTR
jgi:hypothetical protein